jgi:cell division protein YceG involved in septum cleavage
MSDWGDPLADDEQVRERERRRAEREARRRERQAQRRESQGALGDRVSGLLDDDGAPETGPPEEPPPPPPGPPARSPRGPGDVRRRRRLLAVAGLVVAIGAIVGIGVAVERSGGGDTTSQMTTEPASTRMITIPEGYDRRQIADAARQDGIGGDYMKASERVKGFDPAKYGARDPSSLEGFLFPATYDLPRHPTADDLVVRQLDAFKQYISEVSVGYARSKNLTTYDVLIIASMIEREVQVPKERKLVAAVIYNRLHHGMPLQVDATIRYATNNYTQPLSESDLQTDSPYNTYTNSGLPPGPIGNPGLASIQAAAHPADVSYLYYVVKPDTCGEHTFATTEAQFERAKAAYDQARAENGGNAPTPANCPGA